MVSCKQPISSVVVVRDNIKVIFESMDGLFCSLLHLCDVGNDLLVSFLILEEMTCSIFLDVRTIRVFIALNMMTRLSYYSNFDSF